MDLLIVESNAKAKTIQKYLGKEYIVRACKGHVQDLPTGKHEHARKAMWAAGKEQLPSPPWDWTERAKGIVDGIRKEAKKAKVDNIYIATDPDREGEFIAWRLEEILGDIADVHRITFHEITKPAVEASLADPGEVNMHLVDAAKVRRFMDRLVGFRTSKFARSWRLQSMGRVQTPTLGFVVDRELEREAFVPTPYFAVNVDAQEIQFNARFHESKDKEAWRDQDGKFDAIRTNDKELAEQAFRALTDNEHVTIDAVKASQPTRRAQPPFTTDAMLQAAGSRWSWTPAQTMRAAGELYNGGHITYLRTDSTRTSAASRATVREAIERNWGKDHLGKGVLGKGDGASQDAHEAIRPTRPEISQPDGLDDQQMKLYRLIWARFAASQMNESRSERRSLTTSVDGFPRPLTGTVSWRVHAGWEAAYEGMERSSPRLEPPSFSIDVGDTITIDEGEENPTLVEDETKPPRRFRQHTLVAEMKERGIGRPSTYATTIAKLLTRKYVTEDGGSLQPTDVGRLLWTKVAPMYSEESDETTVAFLFSAEFTADMENRLDKIEIDERTGHSVWDGFTGHFKRLHTNAQERRRQTPTPNQLTKFDRLTSKRSKKDRKKILGGRKAEELTGPEMSELIKKLLEEGPPPATDKQTNFVISLVDQIGDIPLDDALEMVESKDISALSMEQASDLIGKLIEVRDSKPRPASEPQLKLLAAKAIETEMTEADMCKLVGAKSFEELTGGPKGNASELIGFMIEKTGGRRKGRGRRRGKGKAKGKAKGKGKSN
uniref:DNA topoisomerase n=1 Tax=uncultured marine group II/III euryarchaeote KM3_18_D06 TaxID=1457956 RepID=A0A075GQE8_9EURY|nr:DNA topoisomerase I (topA) [uncultured marine group II/III euryarchaeote KM3_18_D06]